MQVTFLKPSTSLDKLLWIPAKWFTHRSPKCFATTDSSFVEYVQLRTCWSQFGTGRIHKTTMTETKLQVRGTIWHNAMTSVVSSAWVIVARLDKICFYDCNNTVLFCFFFAVQITSIHKHGPKYSIPLLTRLVFSRTKWITDVADTTCSRFFAEKLLLIKW